MCRVGSHGSLLPRGKGRKTARTGSSVATRAGRPPAAVAVGPDPGGAGPRAGAHRPGGRRALRPRRRRVGARGGGRQDAARSSPGSAYRKHVRLARLEGGALGVGGVVTAAPGPRRAALDPEPDGLLHRGRARLRPAPPDAPGRAARAARALPTPAEARRALDGMGKRLAQAAAERALRSGDRAALHCGSPGTSRSA